MGKLFKLYAKKFSFRNSSGLNLLAILIGIIAGYGSLGFRYMIGLCQNFLFHNQIGFELISPLNHVRGLWVIPIPAIGILIAAILVWRFAKEAKGHGVPEVIESVLTHGGKIRARVVAIKALASSITIAAGGSVGREGPIVQIGSAAGSTLGQLFKLETKAVKILVGCGAAAAIAATFNTPIAGVIFAVELIVRELRSKSFIPLVISSVFATLIARWTLGNEIAFEVSQYSIVHPVELVFYLGLGALTAGFGTFTVRVLYFIEDIIEKIKVGFVWKAIVGGLIIGIVGYYRPEIFGVGYETISSVLHQESTIGIMLLLIFVKILMMSITIGAGGSGGVFAPSLFIGAMVGGSYGIMINYFFPEVSAGYGAYALVGMAALFSATSRATFTSIVILFEMTLDYSIILPLMFACVISHQVSYWLSGDDTIYSIKLKRKGISFISGFGHSIFEDTAIQDIMTTDLQVLKDDMTLAEMEDYITHTTHNIYPVVNKNGILMGIVRAKDIIKNVDNFPPETKIDQCLKGAPAVAYPNDSVLSCFKKLEKSRDPRLAIVSPDTKKLLGIVSPTDFTRLGSKEEKA